MNNLETIYKDFKNTVNNTNIQRYGEETEVEYAKYLKKKQINLNNFQSEDELKNYLQDLICFFKVKSVGNKISEGIGVHYYKEISNFFHARIDEIIMSGEGEGVSDIYEFLLKKERIRLQVGFNQAISEILKGKEL